MMVGSPANAWRLRSGGGRHELTALTTQSGPPPPARAATWLLLLAALAGAGCSGHAPLGYDFDFTRGTQGWVAGFADYPPADQPIYELEADYRALPSPLDTSRSALYIAGTNRSDDLFMYYKGQVSVARHTTYSVRFEAQIATSVPSGCGGVGGAPGEDVTVKAGASVLEPQATLVGGYLRMNVDKGQQSNGGANAVVLGNVANSRPCEQALQWELKGLAGGPLPITTDGTGLLWLFVGTDSGFESRTAIYYTRLVVTFEEVMSRNVTGVVAP